MSEQRYIYWHPGEPKPGKTPKNLQVRDADENEWCYSSAPDDVEFLDGTFYRWPVTEAEWRTHHYCQAYGIKVPEGWRVVDFRLGKDSEQHLWEDGTIAGVIHATASKYPILERIEEWITPTDEDAKRRPKVQVKTNHGEWIQKTLVAVMSDANFPYLSIDGSCWADCRMKKETKA